MNLSKYKIDIVFHMAANADVSKGHLNPLTDLKFNTIMTSNVLEYIRQKKKKLYFALLDQFMEKQNYPYS